MNNKYSHCTLLYSKYVLILPYIAEVDPDFRTGFYSSLPIPKQQTLQHCYTTILLYISGTAIVFSIRNGISLV